MQSYKKYEKSGKFPQAKEQNKSPVTNTKVTEIYELPEKEFQNSHFKEAQ